MALNGYIRIYRSFLDWEWYKKNDTKAVFLHLLLNASFKPAKWQGVQLEPGQLITGRIEIANQTGLSEQRVRTALKNLKSTGEITIKSTNRYSLITVINWAKYQNDIENQPAEQPTTNQQSTSNQPTTNQQPTNNQPHRNNDNNDNNNKKEKIVDILFDTFWAAYPKRQDKKGAQKAFAKLKPDADLLKRMLLSITIWKHSEQWTSEGGKYIPLPSTWLNNRRWEDEPPAQRKSSGNSAAQYSSQRDYVEASESEDDPSAAWGGRSI